MIDFGIITTGIIGLITTIVTGFCSYIFTKKKYNAEVDRNVIENMKQTLDFYMRLSDDNSKRLEKILAINVELEKEVILLKKLVEELSAQLKKYKMGIKPIANK